MKSYTVSPKKSAVRLPVLAGVLLLLALSLPGPQVPAAAWQEAAAPSQPVSVVFYPAEAVLSVEETLTSQPLEDGTYGFLLILPALADRASFSATLDGRPATGFYWLEEPGRRPLAREQIGEHQPRLPLPDSQREMDPENEPSPERRALLENLLPLREGIAAKSGTLAAVEGRLKLLEQHSAPFKEQPLAAEDLARLDALWEENLPSLYVLYEKEQRALYNLRQRHAAIQETLEKFDAGRKFSRVVLPLGATATKVTLRYSYSVPASFDIDYRLLAYPEKQTLTVEQGIALKQNSGFSWKETEVTVASLGRDRSLEPSRPRRWLIEEQAAIPLPPPPMRAEKIAASNLAQRSQTHEIADESMVEQPDSWSAADQEQKSTFRVWKLGRLNIAPSTPVRAALASDSHKAAYYYTLRPASYFRAFLTAELNLPAPLELTQGQARFFVDDAAIGQGAFSFNGSQGSIFFGADPQVTGVMRNLKHSSGESGIIRKEQTLDWNWSILVNNNRAYPVEVRVEDPLPESAEASFRLEVKSTPQPELASTSLNQGNIKIYRWKLKLKAGEQASITHEVRLTAPLDKQVNPGRGDL